jgi:hypothetical protein
VSTRGWVVFALGGMLVSSGAACNKSGNPAGPSGPPGPGPTATRVIALTGDLSFGEVPVDESADRTFRIGKPGTQPLEITGMTVPAGGAFAGTWTSGSIPAGGSQDVMVRFSPAEPRSYSGTLTVNGNQTSGQNTLPINATGTAEIWMRSGQGNTVFDMPGYVQRVRIQGTWNRTGNSNFIVRVGGSLVLNEILRDSITYDGIHLVSGGVVEITSSSNIAWAFTEIRDTGAHWQSEWLRVVR